MKKLRKEIIGIIEKKCPICGRIYVVHDTQTYAYKRHDKKHKIYYFCSWGCLRRWDALHPSPNQFKIED